MSLPDLGRLVLCPTGGTNDAEAGSSQSVAKSPQQEVLQNADIVRLIESKLSDKDAGDIGEFGKILSKLLDGDAKHACRVATKWCNLSKDHQKACVDGGYERLTAAFFPEARTKPPEVTQQHWFFRMCDEFAEKLKKQRLEELKKAYVASREEREYHYDTDEAASKLFDNYEWQMETIERAGVKIEELKSDTETWNAKMKEGKVRDAANTKELAISQLLVRAYQVLVKSRLPEYQDTPLSRQFKPYIHHIQLTRFQIFLKRYKGYKLSNSDKDPLLIWARMLKWCVIKLEELMKLSKATGEEVARMQDS